MDATGIYAKQGFARRMGAGVRPALVLVDFTVGFRDPDLLGGGNVESAIPVARSLLDLARAHALPIAHTRIVYGVAPATLGMWARKVPALASLVEGSRAIEFVPELLPVAGELAVQKTQASAFFGTTFLPWLVGQGIDTIVLAGCTTSGCVRATAVDGISHGFRVLVAAEACADRAVHSHDNALFELDQKYADVLAAEEIGQVLARLARAGSPTDVVRS